MKALSVRQPWAWLIVNGHKDIENRTWRTNFRGPVLIHASLKMDRGGYEFVRYRFPDIPLPSLTALERGGIVGQATIRDCVDRYRSPWFAGPYGFVLADAKPLPFRRVGGKLGFFEVDLRELFLEEFVRP